LATNTSGQYTADIEAYIADKVLPLAQRQLVIYQFGDPLTLPKGRGLTYTATRFNRLPLPFAPLSENVQPLGESMSISQVTATVQQWGDLVRITDIAELTIKHPLMNQANFLIGLQIAETFERNTMNTLMALTQVDYVNTRGSRGALQAGDVRVEQVEVRPQRFVGEDHRGREVPRRENGEGAYVRADVDHDVAAGNLCPVREKRRLVRIKLARVVTHQSNARRLHNLKGAPEDRL
jgi:hypothetical protein